MDSFQTVSTFYFLGFSQARWALPDAYSQKEVCGQNVLHITEFTLVEDGGL